MTSLADRRVGEAGGEWGVLSPQHVCGVERRTCTHCQKRSLASASGTLPCLCTTSNNSPPSTNSITM